MMIMAASAPPPPVTESAAVPPVPWARFERFVGQFTHDVRNGLNALELQLTLLGEISASGDVINEVKALRGTLLEVARQLQVIKTATGPVSAHLLRYPAADFFEDLRDRFGRLYPAAAGRVSWKILVDGVALDIDPELSLSALLELLANALHFGGARAMIGFLAESSVEGGITITLREAQDQPPAVPTEGWGRSPLLTTRRNAYGLGLFRARQIIEAQKGTLHAEYSTDQRVLATVITLPGEAGDSVAL
jgi:signal transduction histidine kinase